MLQFSTYSVISPEGCASILWKSADKKEVAADALNLTAARLRDLGLVDEVLPEPLGGAHRDAVMMSNALRTGIVTHLGHLQALSLDALVEQRAKRIASFGVYLENQP
jgi:acetyl-CoA carboxylase carboxyl transferase subunit alpha